MRPKKKILCVSSEENSLSVMKFFLETNQFRVLEATSADEAGELFITTQVDLVLTDVAIDADEIAGVSLAKRLKKINPYIPIAVIDNGKGSIPEGWYDGVINKDCTPFGLLQRIKLMTARKRGPRPKNKILDIKAQSEHTLSAGNILNA